MPIEVSELSPAIGGQISGIVDAKSISAEQKATLVNAFDKYGLLLFCDMPGNNDEHLALSKVFGNPEIHPIERIRMPGCPEIIVLTSFDDKQYTLDDPAGDAIIGSVGWHSDLTYTVKPSRGALLKAIVVPPEMGRTSFVDTAKVYSELSEEMKDRIADLHVVHSHEATLKAVSKAYQQGSDDKDTSDRFPAVVHPLVFQHPTNGKSVLNISPSFIHKVVELDEVEGDKLLAELTEFSTQDQFIYAHDWKVGDILLWDNLRTMHHAEGYKARHRRVMHRTTLEASFVLGQIAA